MNDLLTVARQFQIEGRPIEAIGLGNGHLHKTFLVATDSQTGRNHYVLQEINTQAFREPAVLMNNIQRVTNHISRRLTSNDCEDIKRNVLSFMPTLKAEAYLSDCLAKCWRMYHYIDKSYTVDVPENAGQIFEGAKAFGEFLMSLSDLQGEPLKETIPNFHNGVMRLERLQLAATKNELGRVERASEELKLIRDNAAVFEQIQRLIDNKTLPQRTTHNDTKINNVLFDEQDHRAVCVIDLDTVMPGIAAYDFADLVRTAVSDSAEDEQDLSKIVLSMERFEAIAKGFLKGAGDMLTRAEKESLVPAARMFPLLMATRFLTDFLEGDRYFTIHRAEHNLHRCKSQLALFNSISQMEHQMQNVINTYS